MKKVLMAVLMTAFCLFLYSCKKPMEQNRENPTPKPQEVFNLSATSLNFKADATDAQTVKLTSSKDWTASVSQNWVKVTPASGKASKDEQSLSVSVEKNTADASRTAEITILGKKITVTQAGLVLSLSFDKTTLSFAANSTEAQTINVTCNKDWTATSTQTWVKLSPANGKASATAQPVKVTVEPNNSFAERTAEITVLGKKITLTQAALEPTITLNTNQDVNVAVKLRLYSGLQKTAILDWGDGSAVETVSLDAANSIDAAKYKGKEISHPMKKKGAVIKIYAPQIEGIKAPAAWLTDLNVTKATELKLVSFEKNNDLTQIDLSKQSKIKKIYVWGNAGLAKLLLSSDITGLQAIECYSTKLKSLDLSNCPVLEEISCENNPGLVLTLSDKDQALNKIWLYNNSYSVEDLNRIYSELPTITGRTPIIYVKTTRGPQNENQVDGSDIALANSKGWKVYIHNANQEILPPKKEESPALSADVLYFNNFDAADVATPYKIDYADDNITNSAKGSAADAVVFSPYDKYDGTVELAGPTAEVPSSEMGANSYYNGSGKNHILMPKTGSALDGIQVGPFIVGEKHSFKVSFGLFKYATAAADAGLKIYIIGGGSGDQNYMAIKPEWIKYNHALENGKWSEASADFTLGGTSMPVFITLLITTDKPAFAIDDLKFENVDSSNNTIQ